MKTTKFARIGLLVAAMPVLMLSCQKSEDKVSGSKETLQTNSLEQKMQTYESKGFNHEKSANAVLTYSATLCNESDITAGAVPGGIGSSAVWTYYKFYGNAGDIADIIVDRVTCEMDPSYSLFFGTSATTDGLGPVSSSNPDLTFVTFHDDERPPYASCTGSCSPFGDPSTGVVLPSTGWYTLGVYDFISCGSPLEYHLTVAGLLGCEIVIDGCNTGVGNQVIDGVSMQESIDECAAGAQNHGKFVSCVAQLTESWVEAGLITDEEKDAIVSCAAQSGIP
jgi:hypothetical protein